MDLWKHGSHATTSCDALLLLPLPRNESLCRAVDTSLPIVFVDCAYSNSGSCGCWQERPNGKMSLQTDIICSGCLQQ